MQERLERVYEYRLLSGKRDALSIPLTATESARLTALEEILPGGIPSVDEHNTQTLLPSALPVRVMLRGRLVVGTVRNVSALGLAIALDDPPSLAENGIVHVSEPLHGVEYSFPGRVMARVLRGTKAIGWAFDGVPSQMRLGRRSSGVWRPDHAPVGEVPAEQRRRSAKGRG